MEKSVSKLLTSKIVSDAAKLFQATSNSNRLISDMANFVYECVRYDDPFILRLTHSSHRNLQEIKGELDWMSYLSKNDVTVPQSILSRQGTLVEVIDLEHSCFFVTAFRKIDGEGIIDGNACTPEVYKEWGRILGKMHCLAKSYVPEDASWRRSVWYENDIVANKGHYLAGQEKILEKFNGLLSNLAKLPQGKDDFALVHTDFTDVNFFIHDREITVFDFDDSEYHWFAYDVAVILFDTLPWLPHLGMNIDKFGEFFWGHFYSGYIEENNLNEYWLNQLPMFMKLREIFLYGVFHKKWDMESLTKDRHKMLNTYKFNIENGISSINIRFT